jgi:hypothetical protein
MIGMGFFFVEKLNPRIYPFFKIVQTVAQFFGQRNRPKGRRRSSDFFYRDAVHSALPKAPLLRFFGLLANRVA